MTAKNFKQYLYKSTGRESHVFRSERPEGLLGMHADLIASALKAEEKIHYLLYSPIRNASIRPFGICAVPASHALAVTDERFLISQDQHIDTIAPTVTEIPFSQVICIEIGNALLLGWLVIRFIKDGQLSDASLFYTARGSHHFERAVCEFRKMHGISQNSLSECGIIWTEVWKQTPKPHTDILKSIILEKEKPVSLFRATEFWGTEKRRRKQVCLAVEGSLLVTDLGFLYAVDEQPIAPHIMSYGVNVCCIPSDSLYSVSYLEEERHGVCCPILRLKAGRPPAVISYDIPIHGSSNDNVVDFLRSGGKQKGR